MKKILIFILFTFTTKFSPAQKVRIDSKCYVLFTTKVITINRQRAKNFLSSRLPINKFNRSILSGVSDSEPRTVYCTVDSLLVSFLFTKFQVKSNESVALRKEQIDAAFGADTAYRSKVQDLHGDSVITMFYDTFGIKNYLSLYYTSDNRYAISIRLWFKALEKKRLLSC
jgi:hypothetical protein